VQNDRQRRPPPAVTDDGHVFHICFQRKDAKVAKSITKGNEENEEMNFLLASPSSNPC
jgi:hypothetical protein